MSIRDRIVEEALKLDGLCACSPWRGQFAKVLGKVKGAWWLDVPFHCWQPTPGHWKTEGVSGCALVGRRILDSAGVPTDADTVDYAFGSIFDTMDKLLKPALVTGDALRWITPGLGDAVVIGNGIGTHWLTVVGYEGPGDAPIVVSVDGGQVCGHGKEGGHAGLVQRPWGVGRLQAIKVCRRPLTYTAQGLPKLGDRLIKKWYNADLMPTK